MGDAKSIDPAAIEMLRHADECGVGTVFSRADEMKEHHARIGKRLARLAPR